MLEIARRASLASLSFACDTPPICPEAGIPAIDAEEIF